MDLMSNLKEKLDSAGIKYKVSRYNSDKIYVYYKNTKTCFCIVGFVRAERTHEDYLEILFVTPFPDKYIKYDFSAMALECIKDNMNDPRSEQCWRNSVGLTADDEKLKDLAQYFYETFDSTLDLKWQYAGYDNKIFVQSDVDDKIICSITVKRMEGQGVTEFYYVKIYKPFDTPTRFTYLRVGDGTLRVQQKENVAKIIKLAAAQYYPKTEGEHKEMEYTHKLLEDCQHELRNACIGINRYTNGRNGVNYFAIPFGGLLLAELIGLRTADGSEGNVLLIDYYHHESTCITCADEARIRVKSLIREVNNNRWQGELSCSTSPAKIGYWAENKGYTLKPQTDASSSREEVTLNVNAMVKVYGNITETLQVRDVLIKNVIFQDPATIVFWADGEKTVVKTQNGEPYDPEKGLAMAIAKRALGNDRNYYRPFLKWIGKYNKKKAKETKELANKIVDKMKAGDWDGVGDLVKHYEFKHEDEEKVRKLRAEGKSFKEIAEILGCEESPIRLLDATDEDPDQ